MKEFLEKKYEEIKKETESLEIEILKTEEIVKSLRSKHSNSLGILEGLSIAFNELESNMKTE